MIAIFKTLKFLKKDLNEYLTNYWSFENGQMTDMIGKANMIQGNLTSFTTDRFGNMNSSLALNGGWTQVPSGVYFNTPEFTISAWVYPFKVGSSACLIDFSNINDMDSVYVCIDSQMPSFGLYNATRLVGVATSSEVLTSS